MKQRKSENLHARVANGTTEKCKAIALALGYTYGGEGSIGQLLDAIAEGRLILIHRNNTQSPGKTG